MIVMTGIKRVLTGCCAGLLLWAAGGCWMTGEGASRAGMTPGEARLRAEENLLTIRVADEYRELRREHRDNERLLLLPRRLELLAFQNPLPEAVADEARNAVELALAYNVVLLTPEEAMAKQRLRGRVARRLALEVNRCMVGLETARRCRAILERALARPGALPSWRERAEKLDGAIAEWEMEFRLLTGAEAGTQVVLDMSGEPERIALPPEEDVTGIALLNRSELEGVAVPEEAVRYWGKLLEPGYPERHELRMMRQAELLLRFPKQLALRALNEKETPTELRLLMMAMGIHAELEVDLEALRRTREDRKRAEMDFAAVPDDVEAHLAVEEMRRNERLAALQLLCDMGMDADEEFPEIRLKALSAEWQSVVELAAKIMEKTL